MSETIFFTPNADKATRYKEIIPQIRSLVSSEKDMTANMANISAVLKEVFNFLWVGFYFVKESELVLGPFQGPIACTRIQKGRGVCGQSWARGETIIVPDVNSFQGHIACSSASKSEIVVPVINSEDEVLAILDIDSEMNGFFDSTDKRYLETIAEILINK
ncbi:MAG: GAF domain-containing protein [Bacteroidales bacterium]|nr:GAF domain-containing protein [Bacteroidales bacterium]